MDLIFLSYKSALLFTPSIKTSSHEVIPILHFSASRITKGNVFLLINNFSNHPKMETSDANQLDTINGIRRKLEKAATDHQVLAQQQVILENLLKSNEAKLQATLQENVSLHCKKYPHRIYTARRDYAATPFWCEILPVGVNKI
ncbi:ADP-ribosylation factor-like protein 8B [Folsomia candida]|uniref:ADP-ribosylation factor-like protein 8B n=1 Tax=Folsomia candida TaxID=158441 RepID=A0A226DY84_FOLCA|nr:ADP-ribosylation factor-like protein 8B [Folsomia candida]